MTRLRRILYAFALAVGISTVADAGEEPLSVNEGPRLAPGIVFSESAPRLPVSASLHRSTWGKAGGEHALVGRIFGPWDEPAITDQGQNLRPGFYGMNRETVIYATTKSKQLFLGWVDPGISPPPPASGLSAGIYSYWFVFDYAGGRADTVEAGRLVVTAEELIFDRAGVEVFEER